jgi:alkylation response protein AidB-like acyl-CoA dehydrogenase
MQRERAVMERFLPGLDAQLAGLTLEQLERPGNPGIALLKAAKGPNLFIPEKLGGLGATALEGVRVARALASRAPSLGIVCTMHNFSMCTLVEYAVTEVENGEDIIRALAESAMWLASGFAEGRTGASVLDSQIQARRGSEGAWLISGHKRPCTLSRSMDFLTASVSAADADGKIRRGVALIPADAPGITLRPFWNTPVLAGAESDEVILKDVEVPSDFLFLSDDHEGLDRLEALGFLWFELILSATYLGIGSALVERMLHAQKGTPAERVAVVSDIESAMAAVENVAGGLMLGEDATDLLVRMLYVRIAAQTALERSAMRSAELLGGMAFISSMDVSYLLAATRALAFHPPSRLHASTKLDDYLRGAPLDLT